MGRLRFAVGLCGLTGPLTGCAQIDPADPYPMAKTRIETQLREWHAAADAGDFDAYFSRMTERAGFLGTDRSEWWTRDEFEAFAGPYFDGEHAWTYEQVETNIAFPPSELIKAHGPSIAWADEILWNEKYGYCRGAGLLVLEHDEVWRIHRYSLGFLVPNDKAAEVMDAIGPQPRPVMD